MDAIAAYLLACGARPLEELPMPATAPAAMSKTGSASTALHWPRRFVSDLARKRP